jgi:hypothetical protein
MKKIFLSAGILLLSALALAAQETRPVAELKDEFGPVGCEDKQARLDSFIIELNNSPFDMGIIMLYPEGAKRRSVYQRMQEIFAYLEMRKFDRSRLSVIEGTAQPRMATQFWSVPPGADVPAMKPEDGKSLSNSPASAEAAKAYKFGTTATSVISGCPEYAFDVESYSRTLKAFPGSVGKIVIKQPTVAKFRAAEKKILAAFGIKSPQVRTVHARSNAGVVELWVIPQALIVAGESGPLVGTWRQTKALLCSGRLYSSDALGELVIGADGSFSVTGRPFESYHDYWGKYTYSGKTGALDFTVEGSNYLPPLLDLAGKARVNGDELTLERMSLGTGDHTKLCGMTFERRPTNP